MSAHLTRHCIAIDIGGTSAKLAIVSEEGNILHKTSIATPKAKSARPIVDSFLQATRQLRTIARDSGIALDGIGIGHPGSYDQEGRLRDLCNIPALNGVNLGICFQEEFRTRVVCDTDVSCGTLGEFHYGGHGDVRRFLFLTLGTGVGIGAVIDGKLARTTRNCLGDPGHIVIDPSGSPCTCGGKGCLEAVASGWAITRVAEQLVNSGKHTELTKAYASKGWISPEDVFAAASRDDEIAKEIVTGVAKWLAMGLASLCVILEPEVIGLGGGIAAGAGDQLLKPVHDIFFGIVSPPFARGLKIVSARVGADAGLLGAAALVFFPKN